MLLGQSLPAPYQSWRFVEGDLYDIARQVREYDPDARLVRRDDTGHLGLALWHKGHLIPGGAFVLHREMYDLDTDAPLDGEPDPRAMRFMRGIDITRWGSLANYKRAAAIADAKRQERADRRSLDAFGDPSERYVHEHGRAMGASGTAFFRDREKAVI